MPRQSSVRAAALLLNDEKMFTDRRRRIIEVLNSFARVSPYLDVAIPFHLALLRFHSHAVGVQCPRSHLLLSLANGSAVVPT